MRSLALVLAMVACASPDGAVGGEPPPDVDPGQLPAWTLEDIQPVSPRAGQTYGLQTFSGQIVVVTLLAGF